MNLSKIEKFKQKQRRDAARQRQGMSLSTSMPHEKRLEKRERRAKNKELRKLEPRMKVADLQNSILKRLTKVYKNSAILDK